MSYNSVENFIKNCEKPEDYNFEYECYSKAFEELNTLDRYFRYMASNPNRKNSGYEEGKKYAMCIQKKYDYVKYFDCDGTGSGVQQQYLCWLARETYRTLWNWKDIPEDKYKAPAYKIKNRYGVSCTSENDEEIMGPDTMNTVQSRLNDIVKEIIESNIGFPERKGNISINYMLESFANKNYKNIFIDKLGDGTLHKYINTYHTIGNFTLVPAYFNPYRTRPTNDYWDKTLYLLKNKENKPWKYGSKEIPWNKRSYSKYINTFFLWDYVDSKKDYEAIEISTKNHQDFFEMTIKFIKRRSIFIVAMLRIALGKNLDRKSQYEYEGDKSWDKWEVSGIYKQIMDDVFLTNDLYTDYVEVIEGKKDADGKRCLDGICGVVEKVKKKYFSEAQFIKDILENAKTELDKIR